MKKRLVVIALGKRNSGKSNTWYEIFRRPIRTGWKRLILNKETISVFVKNGSFEEVGDEIHEDVFIRNASFEEYGDEIEEYFDFYPDIVFCSVQYTEKGIRTINWFKDNGYYIYIQWLNPGYYYQKEEDDYLEFENKFSKYGIFTKCTGHEKSDRILEILKFLYKWISDKGNKNDKTSR